MAAAVEYNPNNTTINTDSLTSWLQGQITGDLEEIPGVGPANKQKMIDAGVENTYQLIGKYLTFKKGTVKEHQDAAFSWLRDIGVNASRNNIILALAEKCDIFMQGIYDASLYEE
mmetsp:Transcript_6841/g.15696  ORF Transcript_6841/g.15696 Transcript_6841/m.15696 type:complete len:115 (+) Transcript_6841:90-434(+)